TKLEWAAFVFLLLFLSSQPGSYHFVALILVATLIVDHLLTRGRSIHAALAVAVYILICAPILHLPWVTPTGWQNVLFFSRLAFMTAFGILLLWVLFSTSGLPEANRINAKNAAIAALAMVVFSTAGFLLTKRHLNGQFENYSGRIATTSGNLLASDPAITPGG